METFGISTASLAHYLSDFYKDFDTYGWADSFGDPDLSNADEVAEGYFTTILEQDPICELQELMKIYEEFDNRKALDAASIVKDYMLQEED